MMMMMIMLRAMMNSPNAKHFQCQRTDLVSKAFQNLSYIHCIFCDNSPLYTSFQVMTWVCIVSGEKNDVESTVQLR